MFDIDIFLDHDWSELQAGAAHAVIRAAFIYATTTQNAMNEASIISSVCKLMEVMNYDKA